MTLFIYTLSDPRTLEVRYVGMTRNLNARLWSHCHDKSHNKRTCWIKSLSKIGISPSIELLEEADESNWREKEKFWIETLKFYGCGLKNGTPGGDGIARHREDSKDKMSKASVGNRSMSGLHHSEESKRKISEATRGRKLTEIHKFRIGLKSKGRPLNDFQKQMVSVSNIIRGMRFKLEKFGSYQTDDNDQKRIHRQQFRRAAKALHQS